MCSGILNYCRFLVTVTVKKNQPLYLGVTFLDHSVYIFCFTLHSRTSRKYVRIHEMCIKMRHFKIK